MDNKFPPRKVPSFCSFRYGLSILLHVCNVLIMSQRMCVSLTMVVMVNRTDPHGLPNTSTEELLDNIKNPVYNWSPEIQGIIFSSIFYGSVIFQIPAGYLSGIYSVKKMVGSTLFVSSLINLFIPLAAQVGETLVIVCRVAQGVAQGTVAAAQQVIWIKWAPPLERGRLTSISISGFMLGPFITLIATGFICKSLGWPMVFYIMGACGCTLSLLWFVLFYDEPKDHPCMSISEKEYITSFHVQQVSSSEYSLPIKDMLKSLPLWAICMCIFALFWSSTIILFYTPTFINSKLHVNINENGLLSALPHLFSWIFGLLAGQMSDFLLSRNIFSILNIRKLFIMLGLLLPALFCVCLLYLSSSFYGTIIFLILACATGSFTMVAVIVNTLEIAPRYCGFLNGFILVIGTIAGIISSTLTGIILNQDPESSWFKIFFLIAGINVIGVIFYLIFAKAEIQDWAKEKQHTRL
ncbi:sodium-dependent phosphate transport protein 1 isoform X1 [Equus przewalskii]|nr:PREDICTED: sodium-dependent phosphate transport protein 1 [Equus przewalskii]XP_014589712.1 sodium-dependent phosphate transport protein 1 [Equus caballus]